MKKKYLIYYYYYYFIFIMFDFFSLVLQIARWKQKIIADVNIKIPRRTGFEPTLFVLLTK